MVDSWESKTQQFLFSLLTPFEADTCKRADWVKSALGGLSVDASRLQEVDRRACGFDIPPFLPPPSECAGNPCLTHPLSGAVWRPEGFKGFGDTDLCKQTLASAVSKLAGSNGEQRFLNLWRLLPQHVKEYDSASLGGLWDLLPAHPGIPSHSIWTHASIASALAAAGDRPALLAFTIASPQEFISSARRTQDFWMGSFLMSHLIWVAIRTLVAKLGPDCLLFPGLWGQPVLDHWMRLEHGLNVPAPTPESLQIANFPNRFTAIVPFGDAADLAARAEAAVREDFEAIGRDVRCALESADPQLANDTTWQALWKRQVPSLPHHLGMFWAAVGWDRACQKPDLAGKIDVALEECAGLFPPVVYDAPKAFWDYVKQSHPTQASLSMVYGPVSALTARALDTRKGLRDFQNTSEGEPGERCTLCGQRSALHRQGSKGWTGLSEFWESLRTSEEVRSADGKVKLTGRIRAGERLCAVCLTRRLAWEHSFLKGMFNDYYAKGSSGYRGGQDHLLFPSTITLATAPFKLRFIERMAKDQNLYQAAEKYTDTVKCLLSEVGAFYPSAVLPRLQAAIQGTWQQPWVKTFLHLDGDWLLEESFDTSVIVKEYGLQSDHVARLSAGLPGARQALRDLLRIAKEKGVGRPSRYYAMLLMDGDHMGDWLSGKNFPPLRRDATKTGLLHPEVLTSATDGLLSGLLREHTRPYPLGPALHMALSDIMKNYALHVVRGVIEDAHCGKLIYAGGDDVAAFVPLDDLIGVLRGLAWYFSGTLEWDETLVKLQKSLGVEVQDGFACRPGKPEQRFVLPGACFTASVGAVIVHHSYPLAAAVEAALNDALKNDAKESHGRAAYALHIYKRSGSAVRSGAKWMEGDPEASANCGKSRKRIAKWMVGDPENPIDTLLLIRDLRDLVASGVLSGGIVTGMAEAAEGLQGWDEAGLLQAQQHELRRLYRRQLHLEADGSKRECAGQVIDRLCRLLAIWERAERQRKEKAEKTRTAEHGDKEAEPWQRLIDLFLTVRFLAGEGD